jgi:hypothetical protein
MQRGRHELDRRGRNKLRRARRTDVFLQPGAHVLFERRREQRGEIKRCEDGEAVAHGEEGECGDWDGAGGRRGAEELGEFVVFVQAEREVGGRGGEKFGRAGCGGGRGGGVQRRGGCVDAVGREVGAEVETLWGFVLVGAVSRWSWGDVRKSVRRASRR